MTRPAIVMTARPHDSRLRCVPSVVAFLLVAAISWSMIPYAVAQGRPGRPDRPDRKVAQAVRIEGSPELDGDLSEEFWQRAPAISEFLQRDPQEGEPATEKTEVKILYNDTTIFFGVLCEDSEPEKIIANERARDDQLQSDDTFEIILDTFRNRQDGFLFRTNPLGAKFDSQITDEGRRENRNWDERWEVAAQRTGAAWALYSLICEPEYENRHYGCQ